LWPGLLAVAWLGLVAVPSLPAQQPQPRATLRGNGPVAFSPDGKTLASGSGSPGSSDNTVRLWNPATGQPIDWPCFAGTGELGHLICG